MKRISMSDQSVSEWIGFPQWIASLLVLGVLWRDILKVNVPEWQVPSIGWVDLVVESVWMDAGMAIDWRPSFLKGQKLSFSAKGGK